MESKKVYIIVRESVSRGFNGTLVSPWFYDTFSDAAERMKKMLSDEKERFSDEAEVSFSGNDQCCISEGPTHSVTLRIEKIEKYRKAQRKEQAQYQAVDLGLPSSLKWSDRNVGAASQQEYGDYFMWGSTTPDTDKPCDWAHAPFNNGQKEFDEEYFNEYKYEWLTEDGALKPDYDAARANMGGAWRMPTLDEIKELLDGTTQTIEKLNGVKGIRFISKTNGNSIFMPFGGRRNGSAVTLIGGYDFAWSSSLNADGTYSHSLVFDNDGYARIGANSRCFGFVVRGVCA